jgi:hypothetical protein
LWDLKPDSRMFFTVILGFLLAEFLFGIPEVAAFPSVTTGLSFGSSFLFPNVPLREGIQHIHTLEHLENITSCPGAARTHYFDIQRVSQPQRYGDHVSVCVHTKVRGYPQTIYMLSRPDRPETCTFMCIQDGTQRAMVQLRVGPLKERGHRLLVNCTYFTGPRTFDRDMEPVMRFLRFFEHRMRSPVPCTMEGNRGGPHANLQWYRRMVLGLEK